MSSPAEGRSPAGISAPVDSDPPIETAQRPSGHGGVPSPSPFRLRNARTSEATTIHDRGMVPASGMGPERNASTNIADQGQPRSTAPRRLPDDFPASGDTGSWSRLQLRAEICQRERGLADTSTRNYQRDHLRSGGDHQPVDVAELLGRLPSCRRPRPDRQFAVRTPHRKLLTRLKAGHFEPRQWMPPVRRRLKPGGHCAASGTPARGDRLTR